MTVEPVAGLEGEEGADVSISAGNALSCEDLSLRPKEAVEPDHTRSTSRKEALSK